MKQIHRNEIKLAANRQRQHFEPASINELAGSILKHSLLHPIVLRLLPDGTHVLVAGERRLRAICSLHDMEQPFRHDTEDVRRDFIPFTALGDLSPLEAEEAEAEENLRRIDLTWQEKALAIKRIEELRTKQAAEAGKPAPLLADIAQEVRGGRDGTPAAMTKRDLILARHLGDPEVAKAKSADDAMKLLVRREADSKNREHAARVGAIYTADVHRLLNVDAKLWLPTEPSEFYDVILTDPPYGMSADQFGDSGGLAAGAHGYVDSYENFQDLCQALIPQLTRVTKADAHLYWFCDLENFPDLRLWFAEAGWQVFRTPLVWYKPSGSRAPWPSKGPQRKYELILYAVKGNRLVQRMAGDVLEFPPDDNLGHSAQKPVALFRELLSRSVQPGDQVLDPCCGTGPIFAAAHELKCRATGAESDAGSYGIAVGRLEGLKAQAEMPL